ncbi:uncharacterized protein LOC130433315 [Triplophysa dalaica]|uniref:uncharacterized protein LOC130433315 n=1 Tax=Triplophysa dalaica TaxID=1582913 RepID=UPI0024E00B68|nr:uncharacterized protein LOC130433315 [Triplophysa dalaica]
MFFILLIASTFTQGHTIVSHGDSFITAFPENLGYFYPFDSGRTLRVTALHDGTSFTVYFNNTKRKIQDLSSGETAKVTFPKTAEIHELDYSTNSIRITSDKNVVVQSFSQTDKGTNLGRSVQTRVVQPITNLGTDYLIRPLNQSDLIQTFSGSPGPILSKRYSSFKLIIINAENTENNITIFKNISGSVKQENFTISSYQLFELQANASIFKVKSSHKVAVILTHPCLEIEACKCNMIVNQILPTQFQGQNFVVPFMQGITESRLLMTSNDMSTSLSHNNVQLQPSPSGFLSLSSQTESQYVNSSGNVSLTLISPGLIIEVIPENMFAACYLLQFYSDISATKKALVIAETGSRKDVHKQNIRVTNTKWTEINGTKYSSGIISLTESQTFIWHPSSKIAVYILEDTDTAVYGGPAIPINDQPDEFGCVVIPGQFEVQNVRLNWTESLAHCTSLQGHLACLKNEDFQSELANMVNTTEDEEAWIGLRRSLMTTEWYWQRQKPSTTPLPSPSVAYVHWADGQPLDKSKGLCASLSLDREDAFKWKTAKCCEKKRPVCYKPPVVLTALNLGKTENFY